MHYRFLPLSQGKVALVDAHRFEELNRFKWSATCNPDGRPNKTKVEKWYAVRRCKITGARIYLHRVVAATPYGMVANHKCGNGLDCRESNLENITQGENNRHKAASCDCYEFFDFDDGISL